MDDDEDARLEDLAMEVEDWAREHALEEFADVTFDGPHVVLQLTARLDEHAAGLRAAGLDAVRVRQVEFTLAELEELADRVDDELAALRRAGLHVRKLDVDAHVNRVRVQVRSTRAEAKAHLEARLGPRAIVTVVRSIAEARAPAALVSARAVGSELHLRWVQEADRDLLWVDVEEDDDAVRVSVMTDPSLAPRERVVLPLRVGLEAPLGGRRVLDASTGGEVVGDPPSVV